MGVKRFTEMDSFLCGGLLLLKSGIDLSKAET